MCTDIGNDAAPIGAVQATLSGNAFKRWLESCGSKRVDTGNAHQIVAYIFAGDEVVQDNLRFTPNWHLTAMTDRLQTTCRNFHFKIEATKAAAHYWHYVLYRHGANGTWHWVGDANPKIPTRNDAGGGASDNEHLLDGNRALVNLAAQQYGLTNKVTIALQQKMVNRLQKLCELNLIFERNGVWQ